MLSLAFLLALAVQAPAADTTPLPADSYADLATERLVTSARAARDRNERLVTAYTAKVSQRLGAGVRALSRDRMLYRQEMVARIAWKRDSVSTIEIIGAREGVPIALKGDRLPEDLHSQAEDLVLNPAEDYLRLINAGGDDDDDGFVYPLKVGAELDYRFAIGDTTRIGLPSGKQVRVVALHVTPRRSEWRLLSGTLWFDADTYGLVRAVFRPARPFDMRRDLDEDDLEDVPGWVNAGAEVKYVTLEYGLYEERWWMPRYVAIDAVGTMGSWLGIPFRMERVYEDYEVQGGTPPPEGSTFQPAGTVRRPGRDSTDQDRRRAADSLRAARRECIDRETDRVETGEDRRTRRRRIRRCRYQYRSDTSLTVVVPADTAALLTSADLGPPILEMGDMITEAELKGLKGAIEGLPPAPWATRFELPRGVGALLQQARYNRVEGLSLGLAGRLDFGRFAFTQRVRIGWADLVPNGELALVRRTPNARFGLTAYRRLAAANPDAHPFGAVNSVLGVFAQRDDGEYFRTRGVELTGENANSGWWSGRIFAERQRAAEVETRLSIPHVFDGDRHFRTNIAAQEASQIGAALTLRGTRAVSPAFTFGTEASFDGSTGDYDFARASLTLRGFMIGRGPVVAALTLGAGSSVGEVPVQSRFFLGGPGSLRGYTGGVLNGSAYWLARAEVGNSFPAARITLFSDIGWAGDRDDFSRGRPLIGAGVGGSFLDGLVRIDLARGLRAPTGWRLDFYFDGVI